MDPLHPNQTDPVDDDTYPLITALPADRGEVVDPPSDGLWDTDPALAPTERSVGGVVLEPDDAWAALCAHDEVHRP